MTNFILKPSDPQNLTQQQVFIYAPLENAIDQNGIPIVIQGQQQPITLQQITNQLKQINSQIINLQAQASTAQTIIDQINAILAATPPIVTPLT